MVTDDDCYNSCEEVREAYRKKGWAISNLDLIDQSYHKAMKENANFHWMKVIIPDNATAKVTVDEYHHYKEDVELMEKLNFDAYRFSISWSRIFTDGAGRVNWKGVAYYNRLINFMLERGITPYANLYHYDLPLTLEKKYNGWLNRRVVVKNWMTMNEPKVIASCGYDSGIQAPGSLEIPTEVSGVQNGRIGILLDFGWYELLTRGKEDNYVAQRARDFHLGWFLDPIIHGEYPRTMQEIVGDRLPKFTKEERLMVQGSIDLVGINQHTAYYMYNPPPQEKPQPFSYQQDWHVGFAFEKNGVPIGPKANSGWLYDVPWGIYKAMTYIKARYGNPTIELQASKQKEAALEATLAEKEFAEEECRKKVDEAKKREASLENDLANMINGQGWRIPLMYPIQDKWLRTGSILDRCSRKRELLASS
ncbi:hypothetical protein Ancab_016186 [Ancistrocladus abbreviatus]